MNTSYFAMEKFYWHKATRINYICKE